MRNLWTLLCGITATACIGVASADDGNVIAAAVDSDHTHHVDCDRGGSITRALGFARPGETITISGTCNESVLLHSTTGALDGVTLDGRGTAVLAGPDVATNTLELDRVSNVTIRGLTVTGGSDAISINTGSAITLDGVVVQNAAHHGVHFQRMSSGFVVNSMIQNNAQNGLVVNENSYVRVGFTDGVGASQGAVGPCVLINNGGHGVRVQRSSSARIYSSTISGNTNDGVHVESASYAEVATDAIDGNGKSGVFVSENSTAHLGNPSGTKNEDNPATTTIANGQFGLAASWGSYVQGRLGTLTGTGGASSFTHGANNNLTP